MTPHQTSMAEIMTADHEMLMIMLEETTIDIGHARDMNMTGILQDKEVELAAIKSRIDFLTNDQLIL